MEYPIQKFKIKEFQILKSKCVFEIENIQKYNHNEEIQSAKVDFFQFDSEWMVTIIPNYNGYTYFTVKINVTSDMCISRKFEYRISASTASKKIFESDFKVIEQVDNLYKTYVTMLTLTDSLSNKGSVTVTLQVEIKNISDPMLCQMKHCTMRSTRQLVGQYSNLLSDATFSDFTFVVKGKAYKVHKNILASESETMRAMFTIPLAESDQGQCIVHDFEPDIFQHMLKFVYAGIVPVNLDDVSMDLYRVAHYYRIIQLMELCKENIHYRLTERNALDIYELATLYDMEDVRNDAWKIVKCYCFEIFFPLKVEPLPLEDFQEIRGLKTKEKEFWLKHKA